jgi:UDPglucose 6-dehydrogenase
MTFAGSRPRLSVVGLGKLGAPMVAVFAAKGFDVVGVDLNQAFVDALNANRAPVDEPNLQDCLDRGRGRLRATTSYADAIRATDVTFIIVPTPSGPDHLFVNRYVVDAVSRIGAELNGTEGYHVVVVTSTVIPGSTGGEICGALQHSSGKTVGVGVGLCYSPEFVALGSVVNDLLSPDMILIGESDSRAGDVVEAIYRNVIESEAEFHRMNLVNAELCKIAVNTFVTSKISFANTIAELCDHLPGADAGTVTAAIGADSRIGRKYLKPAIGYGGPCFPRDNKAFAALGRRLGVSCELAEATDRINDHQVQRLFGAVEVLIEAGRSVAVLGLSYKPDTPVIEESQGVALARLLSEEGYRVSAYDPLANGPAGAVLGSRVAIVASASAAIASADAVVVTTPWPQFRAIAWNENLPAGNTRVVVDPWGIVDPSTADGVRLFRLGRGDWQERPVFRQAVA